MPRLFEVTLVLALPAKSRSKLHEHRGVVVLADDRDEALKLALESVEEKAILAQIEDLGSSRVIKVSEGRSYSRAHVLTVLQTPEPDYVVVDRLLEPAVRPSLTVDLLREGAPVVYSDHYLSSTNDTARNRARQGIVQGWKLYNAEGTRCQKFDPEGTVIVQIAWGDQRDGREYPSGCHIDNLSIAP